MNEVCRRVLQVDTLGAIRVLHVVPTLDEARERFFAEPLQPDMLNTIEGMREHELGRLFKRTGIVSHPADALLSTSQCQFLVRDSQWFGWNRP